MPLLVCATPIGNLGDVTLRVLEALTEADAVLAEDTRHTRVLLDRHGIRPRQLLSYHEHNEAARTAQLLQRIAAGVSVALVSDAGLPGVSDPGGRLIRATIDAGLAVTVLPGPSAVDTAFVVSGFAAERYTFVGFLPRRTREREALWSEVAGASWPVVAFESPQRLAASLRSLAAVLPDRRVAVCRELTKRFEEVVRGSAAEVAERFAAGARGEVTLVIDAPKDSGRRAAERKPEPAEALEAVAQLVAAGAPRRAAAEVVARLTGVKRNDLYRGTL